jgi:probable F420-dependent oxidoreductase
MDDVDREDRRARRHVAVLRVFGAEELDRAIRLGAAVQHARTAIEPNPPELVPVVVVVVDQDGHIRVLANVLDPLQPRRALRLRIDGRVERVPVERVHDRHQVRAAVRAHGREPRDLRRGHAGPLYSRLVHLGVILPNYGAQASPDGMRRITQLAEKLGYDSVFATEHIIVGPDAAETYGRVYEPVTTLAWLAALTQRIGLGTSIVILPLHNPIELAKQITTLQLVSGRTIRLGVGMGWHEDEYRFLGVTFRHRGRRGDEALRVIRALWEGQTSYSGEIWSFENATSEPLPEQMPEIWVGGSSEIAIRRAREVGDVWHPSRGSSPDHVREVKARFPELRVVPRTTSENLEAFLDAGAEGAVVNFTDESALRDVIRRYR